jgi:hypothetical protein
VTSTVCGRYLPPFGVGLGSVRTKCTESFPSCRPPMVAPVVLNVHPSGRLLRPAGQVVQVGESLELGEALISDLCAGKIQVAELRESVQMLETSVRHLRTLERQGLQLGEPMQVRQSGGSHPGAHEREAL